MIPEAEVRRRAAAVKVDPQVIDRDHALGVVLWAVARTVGASAWAFKGGTCLRKAYFDDYRFSEDLDFTVDVVPERTRMGELLAELAASCAMQGIVLVIGQVGGETVSDEPDAGGVEIKVPYRGALRMPNPPNIRFHLDGSEQILLATSRRPLLHGYSDSGELACELTCYSLEEILSEKLRAVGGQRRFAIARDIFDIAELIARGARAEPALGILPEKAAAKGVVLANATERFRARREEYLASWDRTIAYLASAQTSFDEAFRVTEELLDRAQRGRP